MTSEDIERTRQLARNLVDLLASYEAELAVAGPQTPAIDRLHRALGAAVTRACRLACVEPVADAPIGPAAETRTWQ